MSWLLERPAKRDEILALRPELALAHRRLINAIWQSQVPPETLELCRLRMAQLLRSQLALSERSEPENAQLSEGRIGQLSQWPTDPLYSADERTCLEFTELFVIDPHAISDELAARVRAVLGDAGMVGLTTALAVWENQHRLDTILEAA